ncbi:MAG: KilA-N domain-containing protein, partial [Bacteroidota bacterium]
MKGKTSIPGVIPQSNVIKGLRMIVAQLEQQEVFNNEIRSDVDFIKDRVDEIEAKITSVDDHYYTIAGYCSLHKIPCPLHKAKEWGKAATALSRQKGIDTGAAHDERFGKVRTYHEDILKEVIG